MSNTEKSISDLCMRLFRGEPMVKTLADKIGKEVVEMLIRKYKHDKNRKK